MLYRVVYLWATFSLWHMAGLTLLLAVYGIVWFMLTKAAQPVCAPPPTPRRPGTATPHAPPGSTACRVW